ncbi:MAG: hypothetical protein ACLRNQ_03765 [Flavonifractor plautii]
MMAVLAALVCTPPLVPPLSNLIAYSINDDDKMTIDLPALDVGKVVDGSHA